MAELTRRQIEKKYVNLIKRASYTSTSDYFVIKKVRTSTDFADEELCSLPILLANYAMEKGLSDEDCTFL